MTEMEVELCTLKQLGQSKRMTGTGTGIRAGTRTIVDTEIKKEEPRTFLFELFCDLDGEDEGGPPIELGDLILADRANLHEAARILGLFHKTSISNVLVIGSGKNDLAARKLHELNRPGGLARPRISMSQDEVDRLAGSIPQVGQRRVGLDHMLGADIKYYLDIHASQGISEVNQDIDGENEPGKEDEDAEKNDDPDENDDGPWSISRHWELKCEAISVDYNPSEPYTLDMFPATPTRGLKIFGRFNLGEFKGVICVGIIQIGSDSYLYTMTFSDGGGIIDGIWGTHDEPLGDVTFTGVKVAEEDRPAGVVVYRSGEITTNVRMTTLIGVDGHDVPESDEVKSMAEEYWLSKGCFW
ncbi:hypothetical protein DID88_000638 [Monilinia fructigena]|uniref:Uncharacterized protein n=1 Tax=Monilinia fructigena TaxID=38457 RepID=A0A395II54_9HELO|nr:hypothetical protein DID88_000638 [Monilinia fructigena]